VLLTDPSSPLKIWQSLDPNSFPSAYACSSSRSFIGAPCLAKRFHPLLYRAGTEDVARGMWPGPPDRRVLLITNKIRTNSTNTMMITLEFFLSLLETSSAASNDAPRSAKVDPI
jgi:hypothetical protein